MKVGFLRVCVCGCSPASILKKANPPDTVSSPHHTHRRIDLCGNPKIGGPQPWGVFTFGLGGLVHQRGRRWCGYDWKERTNKNTPLRGQPRTPVVARIVEQVLPTPEPTDPIGDRPLRAALLPERVGTQPLAQAHLQTIG